MEAKQRLYNQNREIKLNRHKSNRKMSSKSEVFVSTGILGDLFSWFYGSFGVAIDLANEGKTS